MPIYTVTDPATGKSIKLEGNSPPSEQEIQSAFDAAGQQAQATQQQFGVVPTLSDQERANQIADLNRRFTEREMAKPTTYPTEMGMGGLTSQQEAIQASQTAGSMGARYGAQLLAGAATSGLSAIPAVTAFIGELGARGVEGKPVLSREALGEATFSAALNAIPTPAPSQAKTFLKQGTYNAIKSGLQTLGLIGGGTVAKDIIQTGKIPTTTAELKETAKKTWENAALPTVMNATLHGMGGWARSIADDLESADAQRKLFLEIGVRNPTAGALLPEKLAEFEAVVAASSPSIAAKRQGMLSDASQSIRTQLAPRVESSNETVSNMLAGKIGVYDEANARYTKAVTAAQQAEKAALEAESNINLTPDQKTEIYDKALADQYNALSEKSSALFDATIGTGNITNTSLAQEVSKSISTLFNLRRKSATSMTRNLSSMGEFINVEDLASAAKKALVDELDTDAGKRIISTIENYAKVRAEKAPQLFDAAGKAIATPSSVLIDMNQFRELRDKISSALMGMSPNATVMNKAEASASKAYGAANDALAQAILALPNGQQLLQEHNAFRNYWASTSKILESSLGRSFYYKEIKDEVIGSLAKKLIDGNADEIKNLGDFADAVSSFDPNTKKVALASIAEAIKDNLILKNKKEGVVNWNGIGNDILTMNGFEDMGKFFDVSSIGLGTPQAIKAWTAATKKFKPGDLTSGDIMAALESPQFRAAISTGEKIGSEDIYPIFAKWAFFNKVKESAINSEIKQTFAAKRAAEAARDYAKKAGISKEEQTAAFIAAQNDPSLNFFKGNGGLSLTKDPEKTTGTLSQFIWDKADTNEARLWMDHMKKTDPDAHKIIVENIIVNNLKDFLVPSKFAGPSTIVDISKVNAFLSAKEGGSRFGKLSKVIGPEYTTRFTAFLKAVPALDDAVINGGGPNTSKILGNFYALLTGAKRATEGQSVSYRLSEAGYIKQFVALVGNGAYRTIAKAITNQKYADWLWNINRPFADGVASLPAQQAIIMLNDKRLIEEQARLRSKSNQPAPQQQQPLLAG